MQLSLQLEDQLFLLSADELALVEGDEDLGVLLLQGLVACVLLGHLLHGVSHVLDFSLQVVVLLLLYFQEGLLFVQVAGEFVYLYILFGVYLPLLLADTAVVGVSRSGPPSATPPLALA